jgi:hypothetical protein
MRLVQFGGNASDVVERAFRMGPETIDPTPAPSIRA